MHGWPFFADVIAMLFVADGGGSCVACMHAARSMSCLNACTTTYVAAARILDLSPRAATEAQLSTLRCAGWRERRQSTRNPTNSKGLNVESARSPQVNRICASRQTFLPPPGLCRCSSLVRLPKEILPQQMAGQCKKLGRLGGNEEDH